MRADPPPFFIEALGAIFRRRTVRTASHDDVNELQRLRREVVELRRTVRELREAHATALTAPPAPRRLPPPAGNGDVFALLQRATPGADGWIETTQQEIANRIGASKTEVCRQIRELEAQGVVEAIKNRRGTRVRVIHKIVPLRAI